MGSSLDIILTTTRKLSV